MKSFIEGYYGTNNKIKNQNFNLNMQNVDQQLESNQDFENNKLNEGVNNSLFSNRLSLAGFEVKSIYYCILIGLVLVTPFYWLMYNNAQWFILYEPINSTLSVPKNPSSLENYINILEISRGACLFILLGSIISSLSNLSSHLIQNNKKLDYDEQNVLSNSNKSNAFKILFSVILVMVIAFLIISYKIEPNKNKRENNYNNRLH
jgi:hypothetical protein